MRRQQDPASLRILLTMALASELYGAEGVYIDDTRYQHPERRGRSVEGMTDLSAKGQVIEAGDVHVVSPHRNISEPLKTAVRRLRKELKSIPGAIHCKPYGQTTRYVPDFKLGVILWPGKAE